MKPVPDFTPLTPDEKAVIRADSGLSEEEMLELALPAFVCLEYLVGCTRPKGVEQIARALSMPRALVLDCLARLAAFQPPLIIERRRKRRRLFLPDQKNLDAWEQSLTLAASLELANELASLSAPFQIHATEAKDGRVL